MDVIFNKGKRMSEEQSNVIDISYIKRDRDNSTNVQICNLAVQLSNLVQDTPGVDVNVKLHFCSELDFLIDFYKSKIQK